MVVGVVGVVVVVVAGVVVVVVVVVRGGGGGAGGGAAVAVAVAVKPGWMDVHACTDGWMDGWMDGWVGGCTYPCRGVDAWKEGGRRGGIDGWMDKHARSMSQPVWARRDIGRCMCTYQQTSKESAASPGLDQSTRRGLSNAESAEEGMPRHGKSKTDSGNPGGPGGRGSQNSGPKVEPRTAGNPNDEFQGQSLPPPPPPEPRKVTMEEAQQGVYVPGEIEPYQTRMYNPFFHL